MTPTYPLDKEVALLLKRLIVGIRGVVGTALRHRISDPRSDPKDRDRMIILQSSRQEFRRWMLRTEVRLNILRLCARRAYTLPELARVSLAKTPGLTVSRYGALSEINVTVIIGEGKDRELFVPIGRVPLPGTSAGFTEQLRTSLFAFLVCPDLAALEPIAYTHYLNRWFAESIVRDRFEGLLRRTVPSLGVDDRQIIYELHKRVALVFPVFLNHCFASIAERLSGGERVDASSADRKRIFGTYHLTDLPVMEDRIRGDGWGATFQLFRDLPRVRIPVNLPQLRAFLAGHAGVIRSTLQRVPRTSGHFVRLLLLRMRPSFRRGGSIPISDPETEIASLQPEALQLERLTLIPVIPLLRSHEEGEPH
ncbi:MAG: hypothetical protein ACE5JP_10045 [Candidatus Bipolaricaulia bacterium]